MRDLEDFLYQIETTETRDLAANTLDDVWLADLSDEELVVLIHELVKRLPQEEEDWYEEDGTFIEEEWDDE